MTAPHERYRRYLKTLTLETLDALPDYVIDDVRFKDPFNDVHGADAMHRVFRHMFDNVGNVRFTGASSGPGRRYVPDGLAV